MNSISTVSNTPWFVRWFDSPYYHILYDHRDHREAEFFMQNLVTFLDLAPGAKLLDLPCGKGRHALFLNQLGYDVIGADLSENSIAYAKQFENEQLKFERHDMRTAFTTKFNAIFNLFTSFGYFNSTEENTVVLNNLKNGLAPGGRIVIDFMNADYVSKHLVPKECIQKSGIDFNITRSISKGHIVKEISFEAGGTPYHYVEQVAFLPFKQLTEMVDLAGLKIQHTFGDYNLSPFDQEQSQRLILILSWV